MKKLPYILFAWLLLGIASFARAETADLEAYLIYASNDPAPLDYHLDAVIPKLRSVLKFQNYELMGQGGGMVNSPGETTIDLGKGHSLEVKVKREKGERFRVEVRWIHGGKNMVSTAATVSRNQPLILGGVKHANGNLVVTLTVK